jgi:hypothetical protein
MEKVRIHTRPARRDGSFFEWLCRSERCANGQRKKKLEELHVGSRDKMTGLDVGSRDKMTGLDVGSRDKMTGLDVSTKGRFFAPYNLQPRAFIFAQPDVHSKTASRFPMW